MGRVVVLALQPTRRFGCAQAGGTSGAVGEWMGSWLAVAAPK